MPRPWIGYVSVRSDANTGTEYACPKPTPTRVQNIWNGFTTSPLSAVARPHPIVAIQTSRTRDMRSASHASGMAPSTSATPPNALIPISVVSLIFSVSWMSGASTPPAARSSCSATVMRPSMMTIADPPACKVSRRVICSSPTPGRRSSGRIVTADRAACSSCRFASSRQHRGREHRRIGGRSFGLGVGRHQRSRISSGTGTLRFRGGCTCRRTASCPAGTGSASAA